MVKSVTNTYFPIQEMFKQIYQDIKLAQVEYGIIVNHEILPFYTYSLSSFYLDEKKNHICYHKYNIQKVQFFKTCSGKVQSSDIICDFAFKIQLLLDLEITYLLQNANYC